MYHTTCRLSHAGPVLDLYTSWDHTLSQGTPSAGSAFTAWLTECPQSADEADVAIASSHRRLSL